VLCSAVVDKLVLDLYPLVDLELDRDAVATHSEEFFWAPLSGLGHALASIRSSKGWQPYRLMMIHLRANCCSGRKAHSESARLLRKVIGRDGHSDEVLSLTMALVRQQQGTVCYHARAIAYDVNCRVRSD
jgi:hypothetical protein